VIFLASDKENIEKDVMHILNDDRNQICVSAECVREIIELMRSKSITVKQWKTADQIVDYIVNDMNYEIRPIQQQHLRTYANMPYFDDHRDPRDRMIIAHAITEKIPLISSDTKFHRYTKYGLDFIFNEKK
jgi:PIN domain nuclease of toxin-antitoxin system